MQNFSNDELHDILLAVERAIDVLGDELGDLGAAMVDLEYGLANCTHPPLREHFQKNLDSKKSDIEAVSTELNRIQALHTKVQKMVKP